jgi:hypothetical protein
MDFSWFSSGRIISDGLGDISLSGGLQEILDMCATRIKVSAEGWQLYIIGANLDSQIGATIDPNLAAAVQIQMSNAISDLLPTSMYSIQTLVTGNNLDAWLMINNQAVLQATITPDSIQVVQL